MPGFSGGCRDLASKGFGNDAIIKIKSIYILPKINHNEQHPATDDHKNMLRVVAEIMTFFILLTV